MKRAKYIAQVVEPTQLSERRRVELTVRPQRLAFIIREDIDKNHFIRILEYITSIWGGYYSLLVPTNGKFISSDWWENLTIFRPDKIIFSGDKNLPVVDDKLIKRVNNELSPFYNYVIEEWSGKESLFNQDLTRYADPPLQGIPLVYPIQKVLNDLRKPIDEENSRVSVPVISYDNPFHLCVAAKAGVASIKYREIYSNFFKANNLYFNTNEITDNMQTLAEFRKRISPLDLTRQYTTGSYTLVHWDKVRPHGLSLVILGRNWLRDICLFWNLRIVERGIGQAEEEENEIIIPWSYFSTPPKINEFCQNFNQEGSWYFRHINIFSSSISKQKLDDICMQMQNILGKGISVKVGPKSLPTGLLNLKNTSETSEAILENQRFSIKSIEPEYGGLLQSGEWVVDIRFNPPYEYPKFPDRNQMLCGSPKPHELDWYHGYWLRYVDESFAYRVNIKTPYMNGALIEPKSAIINLFSAFGLDAQVNENHAYCEGLLKMFGSTEFIEIKTVRDLLWQMQSGITLSFDDMMAIIHLEDEGEEIIDTLINRRVFLRGLYLKCGFCGLSRFYPLSTLDEQMICPGCLKTIQPPSKSRLVFKLNELVARGVSQGSIPVLLTRSVVKSMNINRSLEIFGLEVKGNSLHSDIDFLTTFREELVLAECKDFKNGVLPKEKKKAFQQITQLVRIAKEISAPIVILSMFLQPENPDFQNIANFVLSMNRPKGPNVHLVNLNNMGIVDLKNPVKNMEHPYLLSQSY